MPPGTNGGVTVDGLLYGLLGSGMLVGVATLVLRYISPAQVAIPVNVLGLLSASGLAGSVIDSILGAILQATVTDRGTGKVVEGHGGKRVKVQEGGSRERMGRDWLTNNGVNFVMAAATSVLAMGVAWEWGLKIEV